MGKTIYKRLKLNKTFYKNNVSVAITKKIELPRAPQVYNKQEAELDKNIRFKLKQHSNPLNALKVNKLEDSYERGLGIFSSEGIQPFDDVLRQDYDGYCCATPESLISFLGNIKEELIRMLVKSGARKYGENEKISVDNDMEHAVERNYYCKHLKADEPCKFLMLMIDDICSIMSELFFLSEHKASGKNEFSVIIPIAKRLFYLGRDYEKLQVLPFNERASVGIKIKKSAMASGRIRNKPFQEKRPQYQPFINDYCSRNPSLSYSEACRQASKKFGVAERTIKRHARNPNSKKK